MKRIVTVVAAALLAAGCGSDSNSPSVTQVVVTASANGVPVPSATVQSCPGVDTTVRPYQCVATIATQTTNASGQTTFSVPGSTSTGNLCFLANNLGGSNSAAQCFSLNTLPAALVLDPFLPVVRAP